MPIYEYKCNSCGQTFEKVQKFSDEPLTVCECGKQGTVERLLSTPAFHLKGGGWYKDGYGSSKPGGGSTASASKPAAGSDSKTESKPAASSTPASPSTGS